LSTVNDTRGASPDYLAQAAALRLHTLSREGVATVEIKSGYGLDLDNELKMLRVARSLAGSSGISISTTFLGAHAIPPKFEGRADAYIELLCEEVLPRAAEEGLVDAVDGYCANIAFTKNQIAKLFDKAVALKLPVKLHADQLSDCGGAELAARFHALSADHLEYASEIGVKESCRVIIRSDARRMSRRCYQGRSPRTGARTRPRHAGTRETGGHRGLEDQSSAGPDLLARCQ
jgi:imidazolonepropionase